MSQTTNAIPLFSSSCLKKLDRISLTNRMASMRLVKSTISAVKLRSKSIDIVLSNLTLSSKNL